MNRREIRISSMQILYAHEISRAEIASIIASVIGENEEQAEQRSFIEKLVLTVLKEQDTIDTVIAQYAQHWEFSRIALIDRILLRLGICELLHFPDIPPKVTINEAIEIAKRYSTEKSGTFINGILDAVLSDLIREKKLNKSGKGLIGMKTTH